MPNPSPGTAARPASLPARGLMGLVRGYRLLLSPWLGSSCRFEPTCSAYALVALERHGYAKARRIGMMAMVGGKDKTRIRNTTPEPFRDLLISMARTVSKGETA